MNSSVEMINGQLICVKDNHYELVEIVIVNDGIPSNERFQCLKCYYSNKQQGLIQVTVEEAQNIIELRLKKIIEYENENEFENQIDDILNTKNQTGLQNLVQYIDLLNNSYCNDLLSNLASKKESDQLIQQLNEEQHQIEVRLVQSIKQTESSSAQAFNKEGTTLVSASDRDIKVWKFDNGQLIEQQRIKGQGQSINCLIFSQQYNWFAIGRYDSTIELWKEQPNKEWIPSQSEKKHSKSIECILFNNDQLISCSSDSLIIVWQVNYEMNLLNYAYTIEDKHDASVTCISLNQSETKLVSCGQDNQIILWTKSLENKWIYQNHILMDDFGYRICFISDNQIVWQQYRKAVTHLFDIENDQLIKRPKLKIQLHQTANYDCNLFPTIYNNQKQIIIQKYDECVYILKKQENGRIHIISEPIECFDDNNFGTLSKNGEYLIIWTDKSKEFKLYNLLQK